MADHYGMLNYILPGWGGGGDAEEEALYRDLEKLANKVEVGFSRTKTTRIDVGFGEAFGPLMVKEEDPYLNADKWHLQKNYSSVTDNQREVVLRC